MPLVRGDLVAGSVRSVARSTTCSAAGRRVPTRKRSSPPATRARAGTRTAWGTSTERSGAACLRSTATTRPAEVSQSTDLAPRAGCGWASARAAGRRAPRPGGPRRSAQDDPGGAWLPAAGRRRRGGTRSERRRRWGGGARSGPRVRSRRPAPRGRGRLRSASASRTRPKPTSRAAVGGPDAVDVAEVDDLVVDVAHHAVVDSIVDRRTARYPKRLARAGSSRQPSAPGHGRPSRGGRSNGRSVSRTPRGRRRRRLRSRGCRRFDGSLRTAARCRSGRTGGSRRRWGRWRACRRCS